MIVRSVLFGVLNLMISFTWRMNLGICMDGIVIVIQSLMPTKMFMQGSAALEVLVQIFS